ncbi:MAG: sulfatase [Planctomycetales bacterium]|nr:sulfatase [Planctomycetales bacterium]
MTAFTANCGQLAVAADHASPQPPSKEPPNILLAIADDWGFHASAYGTPWINTPSFDRVAREGLLFRNAYTPNAKCAPSRACLLTGRNSWQLKEAANHWCYFPAEFKTWCEVLQEHGWFVGHTQKGWGPGVALDAAGKPRQLTGVAFNRKKLRPPAKGISNNDYAANFVDFLDHAPESKPWCFWYGAIEPHRGYEYGAGVTKGNKSLDDIDRVPAYWPDNETVRNDMLDYAFEVEHFDRHLGQMMAELERRALLDNTIVIVTSDHGMPFPRCKGNAYADANHVPLAVRWPLGIAAAGRLVDDFVSFIDVAPTVLEIAQVDWDDSGMADSPGKSLTDLLQSSQGGQIDPTRDHVLIGIERHDVGRPGDVGYPIRGIICRDALYLQNFASSRWPACNPETGYLNVDGGATKTFILAQHRQHSDDRHWALCFGKRPAEELYDLQGDPDCVVNLATESRWEGRRNELREQLLGQLRLEGDPRMDGHGEEFDQYLYADPRFANYYERFINGEKTPEPGWVEPTDFEPQPLD